MNYRKTQEWLGSMRLEAESGGNTKFYRELIKRVTDEKAQWATKDQGGEFTRDEITKLIQSAYDLLRHLRVLRHRP